MRDDTTPVMEMREFGKTGMQVSMLGLGGNNIDNCSEQQARFLIYRALDTGFNVIDTAECYGESEERIGKALGSRRDDCYLFTKCGHAGDSDLPDWSPSLMEQSIERSLTRLCTDHLDLVLLHSCSLERLKQGEVITILQRAQKAGKVRFIGYSGDREAAHFAVGCGAFDAIELSLNIADQEAIDQLLPLTTARKMGVVAKRPLANLAWQNRNQPLAEPAKIYKERLRRLHYDFLAHEGFDTAAIALRFTISIPGVHTAIVGTTNPDHLAHNVAALGAGPLPQAQFEEIRARWRSQTWWRKVLPGGRLGWRGWV
ncbi:MAG: aldo/keto reductase [Ktedonobacteraceae bacterium]